MHAPAREIRYRLVGSLGRPRGGRLCAFKANSLSRSRPRLHFRSCLLFHPWRTVLLENLRPPCLAPTESECCVPGSCNGFSFLHNLPEYRLLYEPFGNLISLMRWLKILKPFWCLLNYRRLITGIHAGASCVLIYSFLCVFFKVISFLCLLVEEGSDHS